MLSSSAVWYEKPGVFVKGNNDHLLKPCLCGLSTTGLITRDPKGVGVYQGL